MWYRACRSKCTGLLCSACTSHHSTSFKHCMWWCMHIAVTEWGKSRCVCMYIVLHIKPILSHTIISRNTALARMQKAATGLTPEFGPGNTDFDQSQLVVSSRACCAIEGSYQTMASSLAFPACVGTSCAASQAAHGVNMMWSRQGRAAVSKRRLLQHAQCYLSSAITNQPDLK